MNRRIQLELAEFLDSPQARSLGGIDADARRAVAERLLEAAHRGMGRPPAELDGEGLRALLGQALPELFDPREELVALAPAVIEAYFAHLHESQMVIDAFEQRLALDDGLARFAEAVSQRSEGRRRLQREAKPFEHGAAKTGRNDPCPCGSGAKFKHCHGRPS